MRGSLFNFLLIVTGKSDTGQDHLLLPQQQSFDSIKTMVKTQTDSRAFHDYLLKGCYGNCISWYHEINCHATLYFNYELNAGCLYEILLLLN